MPTEPTNAPIGIIAGNGALPLQVIGYLRQRGRQAIVVGIKGEADERLAENAAASLGWGQIGKLFTTLKKSGCQDVLLIGGVSKRPDFSSVVGDLGTMRRLPKILSALMGGDDSLLTKVIGLFEVEGFRVVGIPDVAPALLAPYGPIGKVRADDTCRRDQNLAFQAVKRLGELDIGQAAVAVGGRVVALEGAEGTDAMVERCQILRDAGRIRAKGRAGVLVKAAKPGQDLRVDLPTIGPRTVELAANAQLAGIAVEAGRTLIAEQDTTIRLADEAGIFLFGLETGA